MIKSTQLARVSTQAHQQYQGTCYANAVATVIRAAQGQIPGRKPDEHWVIVKSITDRDPLKGEKGGDTFKVCQEECYKRRLRCREISFEQACKAVEDDRPVLAKFALSAQAWSHLYQFYRSNPQGVLRLHSSHYGNQSHAVVISGQKQDYWKIKNSWGAEFADQGYFRLSKDTKIRFMDVYFNVNDLNEKDRKNYLMCHKQ